MVLHSRGCGRVARRRFKRIGPPGRAFGSREVPFFMLFFRASRRASLQEPFFRIFSHAYRIPLPIGFHRRQYSIYSVRNKKYP